VSRRVKEYEATHPEPDPTPLSEPPFASRSVQPPEPPQPSPMPVQQAPAAVQKPAPAPVVPPKPEPAALPIQNDIQSDRSRFFLVGDAQTLQQATELGQAAVFIPRWHEDYDQSVLFLQAKVLWIPLSYCNEDREWFRSLLLASPELRAKMQVSIGEDSASQYTGVTYTFNGKILDRVTWAQHMFMSKRDADKHPGAGFGSWQSMPNPYDAEAITKLLTPPAEPMQNSSSGYPGPILGSQASSAYRSSGQPIQIPRTSNPDDATGHGNDGSGFAF